MLIENPGQGGSINHLGVEVADTDTVDAEQTRLAAAGLASVDERGTTCCYAKQDKFWVQGTPNGEQWEIYTVLADAEVMACDDDIVCCYGRLRSRRRREWHFAPIWQGGGARRAGGPSSRRQRRQIGWKTRAAGASDSGDAP